MNNPRRATSDLAREMVFSMTVEKVDVAVDWPKLFAEFCHQHGGEPVFWQGRLLFADGWTHSADNHRGPSWPPPTEPMELRRIKVEYWQERRRMVQAELDRLQNIHEQLTRLAQVRGVPVPIKKRFVEDGRFKVADDRFDAATFQAQRIAWLQGDLEACAEKLKELRNACAVDDPRDAERSGQGVVDAVPDGKGS